MGTDIKILSKKEWMDKHDHLCKFEHLHEDQDECYSCYGQPSRYVNGREIEYCPRMEDAYKEYVLQFSDNDAILIMMGGDPAKK